MSNKYQQQQLKKLYINKASNVVTVDWSEIYSITQSYAIRCITETTHNTKNIWAEEYYYLLHI